MQTVSETGALLGEAVKSAPPLVVTGMSFLGITLQEWVYIATLIWIGIQLGYFVYDKFLRK